MDSFWSWERSTVRDNFNQGKKLSKIKRTLDLGHTDLLPRGPWPMEDLWGMTDAICLLWRSLDPGKNTQRIQFDTVRKMRTFQSNYAHIGVGGIGASLISYDNTTSRITNAPTNSDFFKRFITGMHKQMGDTNRPDRAVDRYVIGECFVIAESVWENNAYDRHTRRQIAQVMCIIIYLGTMGD